MNLLLTGGAGYIGSHAALRMLELGHAVTVVDDLSRGHRGAIDVLRSLGGDFSFVQACFGDRQVIEPLLREREIEAVLHFAALTYVGESVEQPLRYYRNNTANALALTEAMHEVGVSRFVFSSTAATYGEPPPELIPICESCPQKPVNPYGASKLMVERILRDHAASNDAFRFASLRYFNVAGCDEQGRLGEHHEPETHLIPICLDAALGKLPRVTIFGNDYPTPDGTCIRDYVHVSDLVEAHIAALDALEEHEKLECNIGIGRGYSVREVIEASKRVTGVDFAVKVGPRRPGDPASLYTDPSHARSVLGFSPRHRQLEDIIKSAWRWRQAHPSGYSSC